MIEEEKTEVADLSYCQNGAVDWPNIGKILGGVAIRSGQYNFIDSSFVEFVKMCIKYGMPFITWFFVQPDQGPEIQIETIIEAWNMFKYKPKALGFDIENIAYTTMTGEKINIEPPTKEKATLWLMILIADTMRRTGLGKKAMVIYTRKDYWDKWFLPSGTVFSVNGITYTAPNWEEYTLWIAAWITYTTIVNVPAPWKLKKPPYLLHQYQGGDGRYENITGPVDHNRFMGTHTELVIFFGQPEAEVVPTPGVVTLPYTATVSSSYLTVLREPDINSYQQRWLSHGNPVIVVKEENGFGFIGDGWVGLAYLENKESVIVTPEPEPVPNYTPPTNTELDIRLTVVEKKLGITPNKTFIPYARTE